MVITLYVTLVVCCIYSLLVQRIFVHLCSIFWCVIIKSDSSSIEQSWSWLEVPAGPRVGAVSVDYVLRGKGFHRALLTNVWRMRTVEDGENERLFTYIIAVNITSSVFVDLDQVSLVVYT